MAKNGRQHARTQTDQSNERKYMHSISFLLFNHSILKTVRFCENNEKVLSIKCELHSSLHVLCPHLCNALHSGSTKKCTESTSII